MTTEADAGDEPIDNVDAWLERNADVVDVERERQKQTESWERATAGAGEGDLEERDGVGRWALKLPDSDDYHELLIVRGGADGDLVGACDCKGNRLHSTPCAHLCAMVQLDVLDDVVPVDEGLAGELAFGVDAEVVEHDAGDDVQEAEVVDVEDSSPSSGGEPRGSTGENRPATPSNGSKSEESRSDHFAGNLHDADKRVVIRTIELPWSRMQEIAAGDPYYVDAGEELIVVCRDTHADDVVAAFEETIDDIEVIEDD